MAGMVLTDLSPVFNVKLDKIVVLWRDAERARRMNEPTSRADI